jgi:hypothetical protein
LEARLYGINFVFTLKPNRVQVWVARAMPTLAKPELIERESPWLEQSEWFYRKLCRKKVPILTSLGYYDERNLSVPEAGQEEALCQDEEAEIKPLATALTLAAAASEVLPRAVLIASLRRVSKEPSSWRRCRLPEEVELAIARTYQRCDEEPGTHWYDVWRGKLAFPEGKVEVPTDVNIAAAALAATGRIQSTKSRGRPPNPAHQLLADALGENFRRTGQRIVRKRLPIERHGKTAFVESGPFYDFLRLVLPPLQAYLRGRRLPPVTIDTIVRIATDRFAPAR